MKVGSVVDLRGLAWLCRGCEEQGPQEGGVEGRCLNAAIRFAMVLCFFFYWVS